MFLQYEQIAFHDGNDFKDLWKDSDKDLNQWQYKRNKKCVIEKLDEKSQYAAIHYAVLANNKSFLKKLLYDYNCGND